MSDDGDSAGFQWIAADSFIIAAGLAHRLAQGRVLSIERSGGLEVCVSDEAKLCRAC
jgi:hypothetical protein